MNSIELRELEQRAAEGNNPMIAAFDGGEFACPWLRWQEHDIQNWREREGVLMMQDWGNAKEDLKSAIDHLNAPQRGNREATTCNLSKNKAWHRAIWGNKPTWLVMNAVWGIRKSEPGGTIAPKTGYLGDAQHKQGFPIWGTLLARLAAGREQQLKVVFAGSWARFDNAEKKNSRCLKEFLGHWSEWATTGTGRVNQSQLAKSLSDIKGSAYFCHHPSMWSTVRDLSNGPPPD